MNEGHPAEKKRAIEAEIVVSKMLRIGVIVAAAVIIAGLLLFLVTGDSGYPGDTYPTSFGDIAGGLIALNRPPSFRRGCCC
ncbi:hypothetical protein HMSSN036_83370 [Paenibacillus macerans]|nr:hypothetical protein HMSSN036_83370 [Paenibacillus macerans]